MEKIVGLDTVVFIYLFEGDGLYGKRAERLFNEVEQGKKHAVFSCLGLIELLTGPKRRGRNDLAMQYKRFIANFPHLTITGLNENIVDTASDLRAKYNISTPDAIHLAAAIDAGAERFITNDRRLCRVKEIIVSLL